jgi:hypothetical protein
MRVVSGSHTEITVALTRDELRILSNALNEVCNALDVEEFATRMGAELYEVEALREQFSKAND